MRNLNLNLIALLIGILAPACAYAWPGMDMPELHVDGRYLKDSDDNIVNLHGPIVHGSTNRVPNGATMM